MDTEQNRELVLRFCHLLSTRKLDEMFSLMADDGTWSGVGDPKTFAYGGQRSKAQSIQLIGQFLIGFDEFRFEVFGTTAEGSRVSVEARSQGTGPGAKRYANEYLLHFECRDGKIQTIREFFDQMAVLSYAGQPA